MRVLVLVVEDAEQVEECLSAVVALDVAGVQVVDASAVMDVLAREAPIFAGLRELVTRPKAQSKLIFGMTERDVLDELDRLLQRVGIKLNEPGVGYAFLLPVEGQIGSLDFDT